MDINTATAAPHTFFLFIPTTGWWFEWFRIVNRKQDYSGDGSGEWLITFLPGEDERMARYHGTLGSGGAALSMMLRSGAFRVSARSHMEPSVRPAINSPVLNLSPMITTSYPWWHSVQMILRRRQKV